MAYVKKVEDKTIKEEEAQGGSTVELTSAAPVTDSTTVTGAGVGAAPSAKKEFVSGADRAKANIGASQRLADKILKPFEGYSATGEQSIKDRSTEFTGQTQAGILRDESLVQKTLNDASSLNFAEQQKFKDLRKGTYQGPDQIGTFSGAKTEEDKIRAFGDLLSTQEGIETQLPLIGGDRKYTSGMKRYDASLLQQTPEIRARIAAEQSRATDLELMRKNYQETALADIAGAKSDAVAAGQGIFNRAEQVGAAHEQDIAGRVDQRRLDVVERDRILQDRIANRQSLSDEQLGDLYGRKGSVDINNGSRESTGIAHGDVEGQRKAYNDMLNLSRTQGHDLVNLGDEFYDQRERGQITKYKYTTPKYGYEERGRDQFDTTKLGSGARRGWNYGRNLTAADIEARDILTPEEFARYNALKELSGGEAEYQNIDAIDTQSQIQDITAYNQYTGEDAMRFRARNDNTPTWQRSDFNARGQHPANTGGGGDNIFQQLSNAVAKLCLATGTMIAMSDGTSKKVEELVLGDNLYLGGAVTGVGSAYTDEMYEYRNNKMSGSHAVFEDGVWLRVRDAKTSVKAEDGVIHPMACENHIYMTENGMYNADTATSNLTDVGEEKIIELNAVVGNIEQIQAA